MNPRIKICCIQSIAEARMAISHGASAVGLVARMPSGPGPVSDGLIRQIAASVPPPVATFLLTSETSARGIIEHHLRTMTNTIQIVDELREGSYDEIKRTLPSVRIVQVIHVIDEGSVDEAVRISFLADALLLDSGNPRLAVKELGGTGRTHNWNLSRKIREQAHCPVFLAGGLKPENVREAIETVEPFGIDVCSGIRTNGALDEHKLELFIKEALRN
jgi:phosphoribosylanthranilate isomerase